MKAPALPAFDWLWRNRYKVALVVIVALAAFFRFYKLNQLPPGLHPDEAANGLDIVLRMFKGDIRPLYNTNGPRESLFFFFQAAGVLIWGNTVFALRVAPAFFGVISVIAVYLWGRSWFGERVGLLAGFLMAVTPWAVTIQRDGFRASLTPLFVAGTIWLYTEAFRRNKTGWWFAAGAFFGLGLYTYLAFRLFPLLLIFALLFLLIFRRGFLKPYTRPILYSIIAFAIVLIPMTLFGIKHPGDVFARVGGVSVLNSGVNGGSPVKALETSVVKTALMFNVHGDENYRQNLGGQPELNFFVGFMFLTGLVICLSHFVRPRYLFLLAAFGVMLLPEVLTAEGIPHALRAVGALPPVVILAALGINYWLETWYSTFPINSAARASGLAMITVLLLATVYQGYEQYFVAWAQSPETYQAYAEDAVQISNYANANHFNGNRFIVVDGYTDKTVQYLTYKHSTYTRLEPGDIDHLDTGGQPAQFIVDVSQKDDALKHLKAKFPQATLTTKTSPFNDAELFLIYEPKS